MSRRRRLSLETKVMAAVLAVLILLPAATLWVADQKLREQLRADADLALGTAQRAFAQQLRMRTDELAARFRPSFFAYDSRFLKILELRDPPTMRQFLLDDVLHEHRDTQFAMLVNADGTLFTQANRQGAQAMAFGTVAGAADGLLRAGLDGVPASENLALGAGVYDVVVLPVAPPGLKVLGALVFGIPIDDAVLKQIQPPATEVMVLVKGQVAASTLTDAAQNDVVLRQLADIAADGRSGMVRIGGQRFQPVTGRLGSIAPTQDGIRYILLASTEARLAAFEQTRLTLVGLSIVGLMVGAAIVWVFVRRITRPLVELRASAEAVGRGDFSRRIETFSNDEFGELAVAFNRMTTNLQTSRAELERALQQVKMTQAQLIQSEKLSAVGQFVAGVAHELNNPLTTVVGYSELLQQTQADEKTRGFLERIAKSAHRCHKIVQSLLSFARQHPPERKLVQIQTALDEVLEIMAYELRTSNVTVVRDCASDLPRILADGHQLQQVFVNILNNARQAIEPFERDGRIVIQTRHAGDSVVIAFSDNGPGIRPENVARIFDPFFTTKPVGKGTGLGLSLCYGIIQEHGGKISARSEPGQGATFTIELPIAAKGVAPGPGRSSVSRSPFASDASAADVRRSVLVIDDEPWILDLAGELLRSEGHAVETATGGEQALDALQRRRFDVVVSDWKMPGLNGVRLYEHLRATEPALARRVLFMTGDVVSDTFQDFLHRNELTCLSKPFASREFRAAVAKIFPAEESAGAPLR